MPEIEETLANYITKEILKQPNRKLRPDEALLSNDLIDSFNIVDLGIFIEDTFGVRLADTEFTSYTFDTLEQLAGIIRSRKK